MTKRSVWRPNKDEVVAENGAVASERPLISETGVEILRQGGNAVDAAVAMGFCAAVVEPQSTCIAGHGQMLVYMDGRTTALDFSHRAPKLATADMYRILGQSEAGNSIYMVEDNANVIGYQSIGVPGVTAGLCKARDMFGSLPLEQLLEPAIHYAEQGYLPDWNNVLRISDAMTAFLKYGEAANVFLPNGHPPRVGIDKVVQRDLGQTLRLIAKHGKDGFYGGDIPHVIEEDMIKNGGYLRVADFTDYEVVVGMPASVSYRGYEILGIPVPSGSTTALEIFSILNNFDLPALAHNSPEHLHLFIEAARHAFADRYRYLGDPDFSPIPLAGVLSSEYARRISETIDRGRALLEDERVKQPWVAFAEKALHDPWAFDTQAKPMEPVGASPPSIGDCTTHFGAVDRQRNMVSCTQTAVSSFGSCIITPGTGVLFPNGMIVFNPKPGAANSIASYKRGLANMTPLHVMKDGRPFLGVGAPGGRQIICCNTQVVLNVLDHGMSIQDAIAAPRVDAADRENFVDSRMDEATIEALTQMGHHMLVKEETAAQSGFANPVGVMVDPETNLVRAGADVFRLAEARGF